MRKENKLFYILQFAGGTFPSGSFSHSWGLETYVSNGKVKNAKEFMDFLQMYLEAVIGRCEGPSISKAYDLAANWDEKGLIELEELLTAMKLTKESKEASLRTGKALMRIASSILNDKKIEDYYKKYNKEGISYALAYGIICGRLEIEKKNALSSFVYSTVNALVQSAIKLVPLGNVEAQKILIDAYDMMEKAVAMSLEIDIDHISNFCPGLDIASMVHENLPVRLYMS